MNWSGSWGTSTNATTSTYSGRHGHLHGSYNNLMPMQPQIDVPDVRGRGPLVASASRALAVRPLIIWDCNGYYRELGIGFPFRPSRAEIRAGWFAKDPGAAEGHPTDARLIYVFKQLMNAETRDEYDNLEYGDLLLDRYVRDEIHRKAVEEARRRAQRAGIDSTDPEAFAPIERSVYADMGFPIPEPGEGEEDTPDLALDSGEDRGQDAPDPAKFEYAYYVWRTSAPDPDRTLIDWQNLLSIAFTEERIAIRFAVGLHGRMPQSYLIIQTGAEYGFLLHHNETPTAELARRAVRDWLVDTGRGSTPSQREIDL